MAKKKSKKNLIILTIVVLVIGGLIAGLVLLKGGNDLIIVSSEKVKTRTITQRVSAVGRIQPELTVKISSETSGEIIFLAVREGDTVRRGDLLVRIKPDIFETRLEQYEAAAEASKMEIDVSKAEKERSKGDLSRVKELYQKEFASKEELDRKNATYTQAASRYSSSLLRYEQSLASLKEIQRNAERSTIFAPQAGIVTRLNVESGEKVVGTAQMAGTEMMIISDLSKMNAEVEVDENDIILVSIGDTCEIEIDAFPDSLYTGEVIEIGHSAMLSSLGSQDQVTNFKVTIRLSDIEPRLRPGMSCNVDIETETHEDIVALPLQAVTVRGKGFKTEKDKKTEEDSEEDE
nr:efflux RND transporter periplasmic adaptor subunit [Candidatus Kapabacteria bacterium]